jgi:hypothetical protein
MLPSWAPHREFFATPLFSFVPNGRNIFEPGARRSILRVRLNSDRAMSLHEFAAQCAGDRSEKKIVCSPSVLRARHPNALLPRRDPLARGARRCSPELVSSPRLHTPHASVTQTIPIFVTIRYRHTHTVRSDEGERTARARPPTAKKAAKTQLVILLRLKVWRLTNRNKRIVTTHFSISVYVWRLTNRHDLQPSRIRFAAKGLGRCA